MRFHCFFTLAAWLGATVGLADTLSLNNGDKLSGTIEEVNPSSVIVVTPYAGRLTIQRKAVKTLQSEQAVTVVRSNDQKDQLFLSPAPGGAGWRETAVAAAPPPVVAATSPVAAAPSPLPAVPPRATSFLLLGPDWKNQAAIGAVNTTGNDQTTTFNGTLSFHYDHKPDELALKFEGLYGRSNGNQTAGLADETAVFRHDLTGKVYAYLDDDVRYDAIKGISLQATATGGLGYWLVRTDKLKLDVRGGPGVTYMKTFDGSEDVSPAAEGGLRLAYALNDRLTATQEETYTTSLTDFDIWRIHSESALQFKLDMERGLGLKLGFNDDYENQPATGRKNNDTRLMLSLTLDF